MTDETKFYWLTLAAHSYESSGSLFLESGASKRHPFVVLRERQQIDQKVYEEAGGRYRSRRGRDFRVGPRSPSPPPMLYLLSWQEISEDEYNEARTSQATCFDATSPGTPFNWALKGADHVE